MSKINKLLFLIFVFIFIFIGIINFNFDSKKILIFLYSFNKFIWFINILFFILGLYFFALILFGSYYKKVFVILLKSQNNLSDEAQKLARALWSVLVFSLFLFIISNTGISVFSGYKCKDNIEKCIIDKGTLRTLYLPDFTAFYIKNKEYISEFKEGDIVYFLARAKKENYSAIIYLILILLPLYILRYKK